jgi:hypothetical protein
MDQKSNPKEFIICFESVAKAIMAEQALVAQSFNVRVMPTPVGIKEGCGFCLRFLPEDLERAAAFLRDSGFDVQEAWEKLPDTGAYRKFEL